MPILPNMNIFELVEVRDAFIEYLIKYFAYNAAGSEEYNELKKFLTPEGVAALSVRIYNLAKKPGPGTMPNNERNMRLRPEFAAGRKRFKVPQIISAFMPKMLREDGRTSKLFNYNAISQAVANMPEDIKTTLVDAYQNRLVEFPPIPLGRLLESTDDLGLKEPELRTLVSKSASDSIPDDIRPTKAYFDQRRTIREDKEAEDLANQGLRALLPDRVSRLEPPNTREYIEQRDNILNMDVKESTKKELIDKINIENKNEIIEYLDRKKTMLGPRLSEDDTAKLLEQIAEPSEVTKRRPPVPSLIDYVRSEGTKGVTVEFETVPEPPQSVAFDSPEVQKIIEDSIGPRPPLESHDVQGTREFQEQMRKSKATRTTDAAKHSARSKGTGTTARSEGTSLLDRTFNAASVAGRSLINQATRLAMDAAPRLLRDEDRGRSALSNIVIQTFGAVIPSIIIALIVDNVLNVLTSPTTERTAPTPQAPAEPPVPSEQSIVSRMRDRVIKAKEERDAAAAAPTAAARSERSEVGDVRTEGSIVSRMRDRVIKAKEERDAAAAPRSERSSERTTTATLPEFDEIKTVPLVIDVQPSPEIINAETNKKLEFSVEDDAPVFLVKNNNKSDDVQISRDALFSYRRDVLGTARTNPFVKRQEENDRIKYGDIKLQPPRLFTQLDDTQYFKSDRHEPGAVWIRSAGDMLAVPSEVPFPTRSIPLVKPSFDEFKDRQGGFQYMPNGSRNDLVAFNNPFRSFTDVNGLNPEKTRLFGATF